ncbi:MAG: cysteine synthase [Candidatus Aeolococcus gillhamiae]|uniref:Cysteine synthase n=2 Tax=Candidatus Aeolococcus gillhamiae TaxID=3127015 RepID=A0A2W6B1D3_9BACT|nr:MAG: cysteine synthase [Candidatus Dormibacter sp. RRmetagenome_bin12]
MPETTRGAAPERVAPVTLGTSILGGIGHTPLLRIRLFEREYPGVTVYGKAEFLNTGGSVKDRAALRMIRDGEASGALTRDRIILDSTSGNTGIAYAMVGAALGYRVRLVMPHNVSDERKTMIAAYGAETVFSDSQEGSDGAIVLAQRMLKQDPDLYFMPDQYNNPSNWKAHYDGTGAEIWEQTAGTVTHFVAALGTSGTFVGVSRRLRDERPEMVCVSVQPEDPWHGLEGMKHMPTAIVPAIYDPTIADENLWAPTEVSYDLARELARREGIMVGHSSGAALWGVREVAGQIERGVIVTVLCDGGSRYLSSGLYGGRL